MWRFRAHRGVDLDVDGSSGQFLEDELVADKRSSNQKCVLSCVDVKVR